MAEPDAEVAVANSEYLFPATMQAHLRYLLTCGAQGASGQGGGPQDREEGPAPPSAWPAHLFVEEAVQHEEEEALGAEARDASDVGQHPALWVEEEQAEDPGAAQHEELGEAVMVSTLRGGGRLQLGAPPHTPTSSVGPSLPVFSPDFL